MASPLLKRLFESVQRAEGTYAIFLSRWPRTKKFTGLRIGEMDCLAKKVRCPRLSFRKSRIQHGFSSQLCLACSERNWLISSLSVILFLILALRCIHCSRSPTFWLASQRFVHESWEQHGQFEGLKRERRDALHVTTPETFFEQLLDGGSMHGKFYSELSAFEVLKGSEHAYCYFSTSL